MAIFGPLNPAELARAAGRAVVATARRLRPDHRSIEATSALFPGTSMRRFYVYVAAAPSRRAPRAFDEGQVRRAAAFAADAFGDVFGEVPSTATRELTVFTVTAEDGAVERALYVHRTGLVELEWALAVAAGPSTGDELLLDAEEVAAVIARVAAAVARRPYAELSRAGRGRRRLARVDWRVKLTADVSDTDGSRAWTGLAFTDPAPPRARQQYPAVSAAGYGLEQLPNRRRGTPPRDVARLLLGELLAANGYYEFGAAADRAVAHGLDLERLPAPRHALGSASGEPSDAQVRVLNAIYAHFREYGERISFRELDKQLDLEGIELRPLAESMPAGLMLPVVSSRGGFFRDDDELMVARNGLRYCEGGGKTLDLTARALAYLARREKPFVPSATERELRITSGELAEALGLSAVELKQLRLMLEEYEWQAWTSMGGEEQGWSVTVACEHVRRFRGVRDGDQYLRALAGESFAHQLDAEEALPRFSLIGETPSLELDGKPIVLRVENVGPSDTFEATVVDVTNADSPPTPWHVRWRGEAGPRKEILGGGHWVLEIARDDALRGMTESNLTPGFIFLQPEGRELFVAQTGPSAIGARYGLPMRVRIRVTPRSQAERSLETVVTLQITEQGRTVLWDALRVASEQ